MASDPKPANTSPCGVCIVAGGLSQRMGRDKASLRLGSMTLLGHARAQARSLGLPARIIHRDLVPRCGPLGGIYTGLRASPNDAELFLACDMPFVPVKFLRRLIDLWQDHDRPVFTFSEGRLGSAEDVDRGTARVGFPCLIPVLGLEAVERQMAAGRFSLQGLARAVDAILLPPAEREAANFVNLNTPEDWRAARERWKRITAAKRLCTSGL